jgi:hypothetical protein
VSLVQVDHNMKLLIEEYDVDQESLRVICEGNDPLAKKYFIEGIFLQANKLNKNKRNYPKEILQREVARYTKEHINKNRAFGECGHPDTPIINLDRVSHRIVSLKEDGNNFIGKAKIMDTPYGKIVKNFIDEECQLGVSSRGLGSLKKNHDGTDTVQGDYFLATAGDIVADPSAPDAFVRGIMENREWVWDNGILKEADVAAGKKIITEASSADLEQAKLEVFQKLLKFL